MSTIDLSGLQTVELTDKAPGTKWACLEVDGTFSFAITGHKAKEDGSGVTLTLTVQDEDQRGHSIYYFVPLQGEITRYQNDTEIKEDFKMGLARILASQGRNNEISALASQTSVEGIANFLAKGMVFAYAKAVENRKNPDEAPVTKIRNSTDFCSKKAYEERRRIGGSSWRTPSKVRIAAVTTVVPNAPANGTSAQPDLPF